MQSLRFSRRLPTLIIRGLAGSLAVYMFLAGAAAQQPACADYLAAEAAMKANDLPRAIPLLAEEAKLGNPVAAYNLGKIYENGGDGVPQDFGQAVAWYKLAADVGTLPTQFSGQALGPDAADLIFAAQLYAQYNLGRLYEAGQGTQKDIATAVQWYERAAQQDLDVAQQRLVRIFRQGEGTVAPNPVESTKWLERLAEGGNVPAMSDLGTAYLQGVGVDKNAKIAHDWYLRGASRGSGEALFNLGLLYQSGYGGEPDFKRASDYYIRAANAKSGRAMLTLGDLNVNGQGMPRNRVQALAWYELAADRGVAEAVAKRDAMTRELPSDEVDQANTVAASWQPEPDTSPLPEAVPPLPAPPPSPSLLPGDQPVASQPTTDQSGQPAIPNVLPTATDTGLPAGSTAPAPAATIPAAPMTPAPAPEAAPAPSTDTAGQPVQLQPAPTAPVVPAPAAQAPIEPVPAATPAPAPTAPAGNNATTTGAPQPGSKPFSSSTNAAQPAPVVKPVQTPAPSTTPAPQPDNNIRLHLTLPGGNGQTNP